MELLLFLILLALICIFMAMPKQQVADYSLWFRERYRNADYRPAKPYLAVHSPRSTLPRYRVMGNWSNPQGIASHHDNWMDALAEERRLNDAERPPGGYCGEPKPLPPPPLREWLFWLGFIVVGIAAYVFYLKYLGLI